MIGGITMAFTKSELILDKVRSIVAHDLSTGRALYRLTSVEDPTLNCTAEGDEVTDALGSLITTLYRAKRATIGGTASLINLDLMAAQFGATKVEGTISAKIVDYTYEILTIAEGKVTLSHTPKDAVAFIYSINDGEIATAFSAGSSASATEFVISGTEITVPTGLTGKVYVEYTYENADAVKITNKSKQFPSACSLVVYAYFKDKCNENITYSGKIVAPKAKLDPSTIDLPLTSTGKHAFTYNILSDYCDEDGELFTVIVSQ